MTKFQVFIIAYLLSSMIGPASAVSVPASAEYLFGPETSQNEACELAFGKAKSQALAQVVGAKMSSDEQQVCYQTTGKSTDYGCEFNRISWSMIEGDIRGTRNETSRIEKREGANACVVSLEVDVVEPTKKPDPNFDISVRLNKSVFSVGDDMLVELEGTEPGHLVVFNWLPNQNNEVVRIIPSSSDANVDALSLVRDDGKKISRKIRLEAHWSDAYSRKKKFIDEWLIIIITKRPQKWLSVYDFGKFKERLWEIPADERRVVRKGYQLTR